jgi:hypothetical protein
MPVTDKFLGMKYYSEGVKAAEEKLFAWDVRDHEIRQDIISDIEIYLERVLRSIRSGYTSSFAIGYFRTLEKRNDPVLNKVIAPFTSTRAVQ